LYWESKQLLSLEFCEIMNWKYGIGLTLVIFGTLISLIAFLGLFGVPILIVGVILIFLSGKSLRIKLFSILPTAVIFISILGSSLVDSYRESKRIPVPRVNILLPQHFQGVIRVIDKEPCGVDPKKEADQLVVEVPPDGMLIVKPEIAGNNWVYFFVDSVGTRKEVTGSDNYSIFGVYNPIDSIMPGRMPDGGYSSSPPFGIHYREINVENPAKKNNGNTNLNIDSLTLAAVNACRSDH
jgi:hypothetical protein